MGALRLIFILFIYSLASDSTLFPYTTLFRSCSKVSRRGCRPPPSRRSPSSPTSSRCRAPRCRRRRRASRGRRPTRSEEHTSELQSRQHLVCRLLLGKKQETLMQLLAPIAPHI